MLDTGGVHRSLHGLVIVTTPAGGQALRRQMLSRPGHLNAGVAKWNLEASPALVTYP